MNGASVLLDANVLYPAPLRDLLLQLAVADLFRAKWTMEIHREWIDALMRNEPHRDRAALERTRDLMNRHTRDCLIDGYDQLIGSVSLPDPNDRHVLAAAIFSGCDIIVTRNLEDFPAGVLASHSIEARHPDEFLDDLLDLAPGLFCAEVKKVRARLRNPPYTVAEYLANLTRQGLVATASRLEQFASLL